MNSGNSQYNNLKLLISFEEPSSEYSNSNKYEFDGNQHISEIINLFKQKTDNNKHETSSDVNFETIKVSLSLVTKPERELHPYFNQDFPVTLSENPKSVLEISNDEKVLLFTPHPDDEILGASALINSCITEKQMIDNFRIIYMTDGSGAGKSEVRKNEAIKGIQQLGGNEDYLIFDNFPFYSRKDRAVTEEDELHLIKLIERLNPTIVFICADCLDPNRTHQKCFFLLMKVLSDKFKEIKVVFYYSIWYEPKENEYNYIIPYTYELYKLKILAMLEHKSQLQTNFMGDKIQPFYERATNRDTLYGQKNNQQFCELYYQLN